MPTVLEQKALATNHVAEMVATDLQPFSIVRDVGFCHLLAELEPRYILLSQ